MIAAMLATYVSAHLALTLATCFFFPWRDAWEEAEYAVEGRLGTCIMIFGALMICGPLFYFYDPDEDSFQW